jgi:hypothetical protein
MGMAGERAMTEAVVQQQVMLEMARLGGTPWRNNVGACEDKTGRIIRYGLANTSAQMNAQIKSSDVIGITPTLIEQRHVGTILGVFTAAECKYEGWHMTPGDKRAAAQQRFIDIVRGVGGYAGFATGLPDLWRLMRIQGYE